MRERPCTTSFSEVSLQQIVDASKIDHNLIVGSPTPTIEPAILIKIIIIKIENVWRDC